MLLKRKQQPVNLQFYNNLLVSTEHRPKVWSNNNLLVSTEHGPKFWSGLWGIIEIFWHFICTVSVGLAHLVLICPSAVLITLESLCGQTWHDIPSLTFWHPSSKLGHNWLRHWKGTPYLHVPVHQCCEHPLKGLGTVKTGKNSTKAHMKISVLGKKKEKSSVLIQNQMILVLFVTLCWHKLGEHG